MIPIHFFQFLSGPIHMRSQVPLVLASPNMEAKSKLLSFQKPFKYGWLSLKLELDHFKQKDSHELWWALGLSCWLNPILNTSHEPYLQNVFPCRHPCHTWDFGTWDPHEVVSPNSHALDGWEADHTSHFWHHPPTSPAVIMWKVVGQHLFLNIIPNNFTAGAGRKSWCDWGMRLHVLTSSEFRLDSVLHKIGLHSDSKLVILPALEFRLPR